jgi:hypothetical protein
VLGVANIEEGMDDDKHVCNGDAAEELKVFPIMIIRGRNCNFVMRRKYDMGVGTEAACTEYEEVRIP